MDDNFYEYNFKFQPGSIWVEIFIGELSQLDFDSFTEDVNELKAYTQNKTLKEEVLEIIDRYKVSQPDLLQDFTISEIKKQNWNENWEKSITPILVEDWCLIRAPFHKPIKDIDFEVIIEPKMSFGTGHHQTTYLMVKAMKEINFDSKSVLDMGCGTGVLAIISKKLNAENVDAIDIEDWAYKNTIENAKKNNTQINTFLGNEKALTNKKTYDVILANINKNILMNQVEFYKSQLNENGTLLVSGLLVTDEKEITNHFISAGFNKVNKLKKDNWICLKFK